MSSPIVPHLEIKGRLHSAAPILASLDLAESIAFYTGMMSFVLMVQLDDYAILGRDGCEIHLHVCSDPLIPENTACYLRTPSTDALYREFKKLGVRLRPPQVKPWGMKELYVIDPHGNRLKFGEQA
ncbi:MAG: VOC family protein [Polaromonas sp.]|nr:VOC family protein [Polaromonas sp.]